MAAATANRDGQRQPGELIAYSGASGFNYYKETLIIKRGASYAGVVPLTLAGASGGRFVGVASNQVDLTAGLGASQEVLNVWKTGEFIFAANGTGATSHIGHIAYGFDDQTVGISTVQPMLAVGEITGIPTPTTYRVRIDSYVGVRGISQLPNVIFE